MSIKMTPKTIMLFYVFTLTTCILLVANKMKKSTKNMLNLRFVKKNMSLADMMLNIKISRTS